MVVEGEKFEISFVTTMKLVRIKFKTINFIAIASVFVFFILIFEILIALYIL